MLVSETKIFTPGRIKIKITNLEGVDLSLEVSPELTIEQVTVLACTHLEEATEATKLARYRRLIHVASQRDLLPNSTLEQLAVKDNDEFILLKKRKWTSADKVKSKEGVSEETIKEATKGAPSLNLDRPAPEPITSQDFQTDLKRILITLIDAAEKILCLNPEAARVFKEGEEILEEQRSSKITVDQISLKKLQDMGFSENRACKALILNKMNTVQAMEWLLEHETDPDVDELIPGMPGYEEQAGEKSGPEPDRVDEVLMAMSKEEASDPDEEEHITDAKRIRRILESFKALHKKEFKPHPLALKNLMEMGFDEKSASNALKITHNKQTEACDLLLSGEVQPATETDDSGFDPDGPICKAILANPQVQLGLSNPRSLLAFLHILQNPNSCQQWLNDPDTGPMLLQISRIYHAEKHATQAGPSRISHPPISSGSRSSSTESANTESDGNDSL